MSEFTGLEVQKNNFSLMKVVLNDDKSLSAKFMIAKVTNSENFVATCNMNYEHQSTDEFQSKLHELHKYLCIIRGINADKHSLVSIKGLVLSGSGDTENFMILGTELTKKDGGQKMKCDTAKIHYEEHEYPWLDEVKNIAEEIETLTFKYFFAGEKAQLSLGLEDEENTDIEDAEEVEDQTDIAN